MKTLIPLIMVSLLLICSCAGQKQSIDEKHESYVKTIALNKKLRWTIPFPKKGTFKSNESLNKTNKSIGGAFRGGYGDYELKYLLEYSLADGNYMFISASSGNIGSNITWQSENKKKHRVMNVISKTNDKLFKIGEFSETEILTVDNVRFSHYSVVYKDDQGQIERIVDHFSTFFWGSKDIKKTGVLIEITYTEEKYKTLMFQSILGSKFKGV